MSFSNRQTVCRQARSRKCEFFRGFIKYHIGAGFTLIELLVVIAVIGILAAGVMAITNPADQFKKANDSRRKIDLVQIQKALEIYYQDLGSYPLNTADFKIKKSNGDTVDWGTDWTPYMGNLPKDPNSAKNYVYVSDGQSYYIYASLDRGANDKQICQPLNVNGECQNVPAANLCGDKCNYGVSSANVSP